MKEEWLMPDAVVPIDAETTAALVAEIKRLIGVVGDLALQQALAQPKWFGLTDEEPVMWSIFDGKSHDVFDTKHDVDNIIRFKKGKVVVMPLYTAPPKREWVELSALDKTFLRTAYAQLRPLYHDKKEDVSVAAEVVTDWDGFFAAIDAKLKEKNT